MKKITKKYVINELRLLGLKSNFKNISWFYNKDFVVVGGVCYQRFYQQYYFNVVGSDVRLVSDYSEIKPLIL